MLSFLHNPVAAKPNYRAFVIHKFPMLRVLDFRKVKLKEKEEAKSLFKSKQGKDQLKDIESRAKTFTPGEPISDVQNNKTPQQPNKLTPEQIRSIKAAIAKAITTDDIEQLPVDVHRSSLDLDNDHFNFPRNPDDNSDSQIIMQGYLYKQVSVF